MKYKQNILKNTLQLDSVKPSERALKYFCNINRQLNKLLLQYLTAKKFKPIKKQLITHFYLLSSNIIMGKPQEERQQEIIQATMELTAEQGIKRVTTQAIADRVGIAQPTIFRHFKTREAIFSAVIGWISENLFKALSKGASPDAPADEKLRILIERQLTFISKHRAIPKVLFSDLLHLESPKLKAALQEVMNRYIKRVTELLNEGIEAGLFREDLGADESARYIAALIQGLVLHWSIYEFSFSLKRESELVWKFIQPALRK